MMIRWRYERGADIRSVNVRAADCPALACFVPGRHTIRSAAGASGSSSRTTDDWECSTRDRHGCPARRKPADDADGRYRKIGGAWEWVMKR